MMDGGGGGGGKANYRTVILFPREAGRARGSQ